MSQCIPLPNRFERNIYDDFAELYGDKFVEKYSTTGSSFRFIDFEIFNVADIEQCASLKNPYKSDCGLYTSATMDVDYLKILEK